MKIFFTILIIYFFNYIGFCFANEPVTASVDRTKTFIDEPIYLSLIIENGDGSEEIILPESPNYIMKSAGTSHETSIINGKVNSSVVYNYAVVPKKIGITQINPIKVNKQGHTYETTPIHIEIVAANNRPNSYNSDDSTNDAGDDVKVELKLDKSTIYVDEPVAMHYKILRKTNVKIGNAGYNLPKLEDFVSEKEEQASDLVTLNGIAYEVTEIKTVIYPSKPGTFTIGPGTLSCEVYKQRRQQNSRRHSMFPGLNEDDFFDDQFSAFFGGGMTATPIKLSSNQVTLTVKPLPALGKPDNFSGTVGNYRFSVEYSDLSKLKKGDAINLTMTIEGAGHISTIGEPRLINSEGFKAFDSEVSVLPLSSIENIAGRKIFKKIIIPEKAGKIKIPDVELNFFNPMTEKYEVLKKEGPEVNVLDVLDSEFTKKLIEAESSTLKNKEALKIKTQDIIYINTNLEILNKHIDNISWNYFLFAVLGGPLLYFLILIPSSYMKRLKTDSAYRRSKRAYHVFKKCIKNNGESAALLSKALTDYFADKLNLPTGTWTKSEIEQKLSAIGVPETLNKTFTSNIEKLDMFQYGMSTLKKEDWKLIVDSAYKAVKELEGLKVWKK